MAGDDGVVVQELVPGGGEAQWSYAALWDRGRPVLSLTARRLRQYPIEFGATSTFVETADNPEVVKLAEMLLQSVTYHGVVEVEFKHDARDGRHKLLDVNTRPWTWTALGAKAGTDFTLGAWQLANGVDVAPAQASAGYAWTHLSRDIIAALSLMLAGRATLGGYLTSLRQPLCFAAMQMNDPLPGLMDIPILVPRLFARLKRQRAAQGSSTVAAE
jgi:D-aspartate ligase